MRKWWQKLSTVLIGAGALLFAFITPALADAEVSNEVVAGGENVITIPYTVWAVVVGTVVPLLVGLLTKLQARSGLKILINLALSAVSGLVGTVVVADGAAVLSWSAVAIAALTFVQSIATYNGIWKPLDVPPKLAPNAGLG